MSVDQAGSYFTGGLFILLFKTISGEPTPLMSLRRTASGRRAKAVCRTRRHDLGASGPVRMGHAFLAVRSA